MEPEYTVRFSIAYDDKTFDDHEYIYTDEDSLLTTLKVALVIFSNDYDREFYKHEWTCAEIDDDVINDTLKNNVKDIKIIQTLHDTTPKEA
jgi:hypothetical protein